jgi:hypothetical protein
MSTSPRTSTSNPRLALVAAAVCALGLFASHDASAALPAAATTWKTTLPALPAGATSWKVSVGVYNSQGVLVRSLVRGASLAPGLRSGIWNGKNDAGVSVPTGSGNPYTIRLAYHNIGYAWEGVIGNTSSSFDGTGVHAYMQPVNGIAIQGSNAYMAVGYNEGQPGLSGFALSAPNTALRQLPSTDAFVAYAMVAADASNVYAANIGGFAKTSFVRAFNRSSSAAVNLSSGQSVCLNYLSPGVCYPDQSY